MLSGGPLIAAGMSAPIIAEANDTAAESGICEADAPALSYESSKIIRDDRLWARSRVPVVLVVRLSRRPVDNDSPRLHKIFVLSTRAVLAFPGPPVHQASVRRTE